MMVSPFAQFVTMKVCIVLFVLLRKSFLMRKSFPFTPAIFKVVIMKSASTLPLAIRNKLPVAIPDGDISCREQSFYEVFDKEAQDFFARRVVSRFRRSSEIVLEGQVKLDV